MTRTWTAEVRVGRERIAASLSRYDLLRDQSDTAVREAALFLDDATEVSVAIYKTTRARGTELDRTYSVSRDRRGRVVYQ